MDPLSCFSDLLSGRAGDSRPLESFPDGKSSDATNIYWRLLGAKGSLGLDDKQLGGCLALSSLIWASPKLWEQRFIASVLQKRKLAQGIKWPAEDHPAQIFHCFFKNPNVIFLWLKKKKSLKFVDTWLAAWSCGCFYTISLTGKLISSLRGLRLTELNLPHLLNPVTLSVQWQD